MLYSIYAIDRSNSSQVRSSCRREHLEYLDRYAEQVKLGGPLLGEDETTPIGSLLVVEFNSREEVEEFVAHEPYSRSGLFEVVQIRPWRKVMFDG